MFVGGLREMDIIFIPGGFFLAYSTLSAAAIWLYNVA